MDDFSNFDSRYINRLKTTKALLSNCLPAFGSDEDLQQRCEEFSLDLNKYPPFSKPNHRDEEVYAMARRIQHMRRIDDEQNKQCKV